MKTCLQCHKVEISGLDGDFCDRCSAYRGERREREQRSYSECIACEIRLEGHCFAVCGQCAAIAKDARDAARKGARKSHDAVDHPAHYTAHPSGVECIAITEHMTFNVGNAIKYLWRADEKGDALQDLEKARWYIDREIARRRASP